MVAGGWAATDNDNIVSAVAEKLTADEPDTGIIDQVALEAIHSLQTEGNEDILTRIINIYLSDAPQQMIKLQQALDDQDAVGLRNIAHSLKSSSANLGAMQLSALFKELEEKARLNSLLGTGELFDRAEIEFSKVAGQLKKQRADYETS